MKIAMVISRLVDQGGGERQFLYLARELKKKGHKIILYSVEYEKKSCYPEMARDLDIRFIYKNRRRRKRKKILPTLDIYWYYLRLYPDLMKIARLMENDYDIVNCHAEGSHWLAPLIRKKARSIVWMCNDIPTWIAFSQRNPRGIRGLKMAKFYIDKYLFATFLGFIDRMVMRYIDKIAVLSTKVKEIMSMSYRRKVVVVRSGVDIDYFSNIDIEKRRFIRQRYGIGIHDFLVFSLSLLQPLRCLEDLIIAVEILIRKGRKIWLVLGGDLNYNVNYSNYLMELVQEKGLTSQILFIGKVLESELQAHYQATDVFVFPSDERQTWGLVVFEAMASQKPVIVSNVCGASEVLEDGKTAYLFPTGSPDVLAKKIEILMQDSQKASEIAQRGYEYTKDKFSWKKYAADMEEVFTDSRAFIST